MKHLLNIVKGILVGMAIMIPGVSGGSMVMSMGLYPALLALISGTREERKGTLPVLLPFGIGVLAGIVLFSFLLAAALANFPLQTAMAFIGLILGGIPMLWRQVRGKRVTLSNGLGFFGAVAVMALMLILSARANLDLSLAPSVWHCALALILGFLSASTMIVPGVSGSALMLILGYYYEITGRVKTLSTAIVTANGQQIAENVLVFVPYLIGAVLGIVLTSKAIQRLIQKHPSTTYYTLIGLMAASPAAVLCKITVDYGAVSLPGYLMAALCLAVGFTVAYVLSRDEEGEHAEKGGGAENKPADGGAE